MNKTPFELRVELLNQAQSILMSKYYSEMEILRNNADARERATNHPEPIPLSDLPQFPTTREIIVEAEKLRAFVNDK
jgi:hypothetical protein